MRADSAGRDFGRCATAVFLLLFMPTVAVFDVLAIRIYLGAAPRPSALRA